MVFRVDTDVIANMAIRWSESTPAICTRIESPCPLYLHQLQVGRRTLAGMQRFPRALRHDATKSSKALILQLEKL